MLTSELEGMLIDPAKLALILISPMQRARKTYELMFAPTTRQIVLESKAIITPELTEWKYGDYEGLTTKEIRKLRESRGLNGKDWDHFRDGWYVRKVLFATNPSRVVAIRGHMPSFGSDKLLCSPELSRNLGKRRSSAAKVSFCFLKLSSFSTFDLERATLTPKSA